MSSSEHDIHVRKALAWSACNKLCKIWKSELSRYIKVRLFRAIVESILLYGSETWTLTKELTKRLDGTYTRMLRCALNISWKSHTTNEVLYGSIPRLSENAGCWLLVAKSLVAGCRSGKVIIRYLCLRNVSLDSFQKIYQSNFYMIQSSPQVFITNH